MVDRVKLAWYRLAHHMPRLHCISTGHQSLNRIVIFILLFLFISLNLIDIQDMLRFYRHKIHWTPKDDVNENSSKRMQMQEYIKKVGNRPGVKLPGDADGGKLSHASQPRHPNHHFALLLLNSTKTHLQMTRHQLSNHKFPHHRHRYLVHTKTCRMIEWPLYDEETGPMIREFRDRTFNCRQPSIRIERLNGTLLYVEEVKRSSSNSNLQCFVDELTSNTGDAYTFGKRFGPITSTVTDFPKLSSVRVECYRLMRPLHSSLKLLAKVESKVLPLVPVKIPKFSPQNADQPNVLVLGIDSISWLNFRRYFAKSKRFIETNHFVPLYGFTKVGDNTFPNMMAVLTGHHYTTYWNSSIGYDMRFDDVPFIWKQFAKQGYLTALVEDMPAFSLFNYGRAGFSHPPTDYYLRPVSMLVDDNLNNHFCYKGQIGMEYYYSWILDQVTTLKNRSQPFFTFAHLADLTHNNFWTAGKADQPLYKLLSELFRRKLHQNTFIFLLADHGIRFGPLRRTRSGQIEERLPFFYIYVPENLGKQTFPVGTRATQLKATLRANSHRLTSHFDLHATLRHIVERKAPTDEQFGRSLFTRIPLNRTCELAGISEEWCLCSHFDTFTGTEQSKQILGLFVAGQVNRIVADEPKCAHLKLTKVKQVLIRTEPQSTDGSNLFTVQVELKPGDGIFDATVRVKNVSLLSLNSFVDSLPVKSLLPNVSLIGDISRINSYGNQSACIDDSVREKYCFCTSNLSQSNELQLNTKLEN